MWKGKTKSKHLRVHQMSLQNNQMNQNTATQKMSSFGGENKGLQEDQTNNGSELLLLQT